MTSAPTDRKVGKEAVTSESQQYVGPYRLEKTLGKGQTGTDTQAPLALFVPEGGTWANGVYLSFGVEGWALF